jgi:hypothetical protein
VRQARILAECSERGSAVTRISAKDIGALARSLLVTLLKSLPVGIGLSLATPAQAVNDNLYLIALAGQSNMTGAGDVKLLPVGFPMNGPRIWNFTNADT